MARHLACFCTYYAGLSVATITVEEDEVKLADRLCQALYLVFFLLLWFTTVVFIIIMFSMLAMLVVTFHSISI